MKHYFSFLSVVAIVGAVGCSSQIESTEPLTEPTPSVESEVTEPSVLAPPDMEVMNLTVGASDGDWCGNSRVSDSAYLRNRSIGAFKCAANAFCGRFGPTAAMACSLGLTSILEGAKDDPDVNNILMSLIGAAAMQIDSEMTLLTLIAQNKELYEKLVKKQGKAAADKAFKAVIQFATDPRLKPTLNKIPKTTWLGLLISCAEALRGACDLVVNTYHAVGESWTAWIDPDFKGSIPGCSKSTAVAVTDYTYVFWNGAQATLRSCVESCRAEADSCNGDKRLACHWWNACVNYCSATKTGSVTAGASYRMMCPAAPKPDAAAVANAYLKCLGRAPSQDEARGWIAAQLKGEPVVEQICNSAEARRRAAAGAYVACLGREGSASEIDAWANGPTATGDIRTLICASDEAKAYLATVAGTTPPVTDVPPVNPIDAGPSVPPVTDVPPVNPIDAGPSVPPVTDVPPVIPMDAGVPTTPPTDTLDASLSFSDSGEHKVRLPESLPMP